MLDWIIQWDLRIKLSAWQMIRLCMTERPCLTLLVVNPFCATLIWSTNSCSCPLWGMAYKWKSDIVLPSFQIKNLNKSSTITHSPPPPPNAIIYTYRESFISPTSWNVFILSCTKTYGFKENIYNSLIFSQVNVSTGRTKRRPDLRSALSQRLLVHSQHSSFCLYARRRRKAPHKTPILKRFCM